MSCKTNILNNGCKQSVFTGANTVGLRGTQYNGSGISLNEEIYTINTRNYYNFCVSFSDFNRYATIKSVKLRVYTPNDASETRFLLTLTTNYTSNFGDATISFKYYSNYIETDISKYILDQPANMYYFSLFAKNTGYIFNESAIDGQKPELIVEYIDTDQGLINQKYISGSVGGRQNYSINVRNGQPFLSKKLLELGGMLQPLNLTLEYNGLNTTSRIFESMPRGWKFNYQQKIQKYSSHCLYTDSVGNVHTFMLADNSNNIYYDVSGTGLILEVVSDGTFKIFDGYNNYLIFDNRGYLIEIRHVVDGVAISSFITYDSSYQMVSITDGMNRTISFTYSGDTITISGVGINDVVIKKNSNDYLEKITELNSRETSYSFAYSGLVSNITSDNGESVDFVYDGMKRVLSVTNSVNKPNQETVIVSRETFTYKPMSTFVENYQGITHEYGFDELGELVCVSDMNSGEVGSMGSIVKYDFETYSSSGNVDEEVYMGFLDIDSISSNNTVLTYSAAYNASLSKGNLKFKANQLYTISFAYKITGDVNTESKLSGDIEIVQNNVVLEKIELDPKMTNDKSTVVIFKSNGTDLPQIKLNYCGDGERFCISKIRIYKYNPQIEKVCLNLNTGLSKCITAKSINWYPIGSNFKSEMYKEDLIENLKNIHIPEYSSFLWYNKKRKLVVSNEKYVNISGSNVSLSSLKLAIYAEDKTSKLISFSDYAAGSDFRRDYNICFIGTNQTETYTDIDENFLVKTSKDHRRITKSFTYDVNGNVLSETVKHQSESQCMRKEYEYQNGFLTKEIAHINGTTTSVSYAYNENTGEVVSVTDSNGLVLSYNYNQESGDLIKLSTIVNSVENANEVEYDKDLVTKLKGNTPGVSIEYDSYNCPKKFSINGTVLLETNNTIDDTGATLIEKYGYGHDYFLKKEVDKYGNVFQISESTDGENYSVIRKVFYSDLSCNDISSIVDPNSESLKKTSKSKIRRITDTLGGNSRIFTYDAEGNLESVMNNMEGFRHVYFTYDKFGRVTQKEMEISDRDVLTATVTYKDGFDNTIESVETDYNYTFNTENDSVVIVNYDAVKCKIKNVRDNLGRITQKQYYHNNSSSAETASYEYLTNGNDTTCLIKREVHTGLLNEEYRYLYDNSGRIISVKDKNDNLLVRYEYDTLGRLVREDNKKLNKTLLWEYDKNGNITLKKEAVFTTGEVEIFINVPYEYSLASKDELTKFNNETIIMSGGAVTSFSDATFQWVKGNKLNRISYINGKYVSFDYDCDGLRTSKTYYDSSGVHTHDYSFDGNKIVREIISSQDGNKKLHYLYVNDEIVGFTYNQEKYKYKKNFRNDIIAICDSSNNLVARYEYDAWGNCVVFNADGSINTSPTFIGNINPFRYRGYYYDVETGLFWCNSRYYNPEWGRWISPDSIEYLDPESINGLNLYAYCGNDPVNMFDPDGHSAVALFVGTIIGVVLGGIYGEVSAAQNGQDVFSGGVIGAITGGLTGAIVAIPKLAISAMLGLTFAVGVAGDIFSQMVLDDKEFGEVNLIQSTWSGVVNAFLAIPSKALGILDSVAELTSAGSIIFGVLTNSPLIGLGMSLNTYISRNCGSFTLNDIKQIYEFLKRMNRRLS